MKNESGFTFPEALVVLLIATLVLSFSILYSYRTSIKIEETQFFLLLKQDILSAQVSSIEQKRPYAVNFSSAQNVYTIHSGINELKRVKFPDSVRFKDTSYLSIIQFTADGSITSFGTAIFITSKGDKTITVHIGKGRVQLE
ncbi:competence protein ComGD [Chryseomicrobium aureum]|uniref:competence type IV pilus minor pilin ComGD n=1 Tax=Chryseomicrobium aureum TaxID=1441723 RepID=UPI001959B313|nr:competence type IV pilus minor pilin ComGD [Chryseomicrobium aureum]MBM7705721.1 competence protein ComGD [Chryseomicrobium aureum]